MKLERVMVDKGQPEVEGFPREKILLYALKRELSERKTDELNCPVVRRLVIEAYRAISLDH